MNESQNKLAQNFKALREKLKLTQKEMAESLGVSTVYISYIENGSRLPSRKFLNKAYALQGKQQAPQEILQLLKASKNPKLPRQAERGNTVYQLQAAGLYTGAKLQRLLKKEPNRLIYILGLFHFYQEQGQFQEADRVILNAIPLMEEAEDRKWLEAYHFQLEGTARGYERAFEIMTEALNLFDQNHPKPDKALKEKKAELLFRTALIHFDYGHYLFQQMSELEAGALQQARAQFEAALSRHLELRQYYFYPFSQLDFANIRFWLGLISLYQRHLLQSEDPQADLSALKHEEMEHWQMFIAASKDAQIYDFQQRWPDQQLLPYFSDEYLTTNLSYMALAYARMALLSQSPKEQVALLREGEWLLSRHNGKVRDDETRYRYYYNLGHYYCLKAEILAEMSPKNEQIERSLNNSEQSLRVASEADHTTLLEELQLPQEYLYYRTQRKDTLMQILGDKA